MPTAVHAADYSLNTRDHGADTTISEDNPAAGADLNVLELHSYLSPFRHRVTALRFDTSSVVGTVTGATLSLEVTQASPRTFSIDLYGLVDGTPGETAWGETTVSYNTMPGLAGANGNVDRDHAAGTLTFLGSYQYTANYTGSIGFTSLELADFLNANSNNSVTFLLEAQVSAGNQHYIQIRSNRNSIIGSQFYPTLEITAIPEPSTAAIMAGAAVLGLAVLGRKRILR